MYHYHTVQWATNAQLTILTSSAAMVLDPSTTHLAFANTPVGAQVGKLHGRTNKTELQVTNKRQP